MTKQQAFYMYECLDECEDDFWDFASDSFTIRIDPTNVEKRKEIVLAYAIKHGIKNKYALRNHWDNHYAKIVGIVFDKIIWRI